MKVVAIIQARLSSTRLPGKVLRPLLGHPMLHWVVNRVRRAAGLETMVATSEHSSDDELVRWCFDQGVTCYRGPLDDVLARYYGAAQAAGADIVVRVTSDCPFVDPAIVETVVERLVTGKLDYTGNSRERSYPHGADVEAFTMDALRAAHVEADQRYEREHVTPFIWTRPERFRQCQVVAPPDLYRPELRVTVDTIEDFMLAQALYEELGDGFASLRDVIALVERKPWLPFINHSVRQKQVFSGRDPNTRVAREFLEAARLALTQDMFNAATLLAQSSTRLVTGREGVSECDKELAVLSMGAAAAALADRESE